MKRTPLLLSALLLATAATADVTTPMMAQTIHLAKGWNTFYLQVTPDATADQIFAGWPVQSVGLYDAAAYTGPHQFAAGLNTEGVAGTGMLVWRRNDPAASTFTSLSGNSVYQCYASSAYTATIYGIPEAARITWHATDTNTVLNYIGVSLVSNNVTAPLSAYFSGCDAGYTFAKYVYGTTDAAPQLVPYNATTVSDGGVLVMDAARASNWSGALYVTPASGVNFSTNILSTSVSVRNDGATARTVQLSMRGGDAPNALALLPVPTVMWRDTDSFDPWQTNLVVTPATRLLQPGETWTVALALDREANFTGVAPGTVYGGLLQFSDITDNGSRFRTTIPLIAVSDGGAAMRSAWPAGLWLCEAKLDHVTQIVDDGTVFDVAGAYADRTVAGGRLTARLLIHVDDDGVIRLLQRVSVVATTNGLGETVRGLYAPTAARPAGSAEILRISSVVLPTDLGFVEGTGGAVEGVDEGADEGTDSCVFGDSVIFSFTVSEDSNVNPFRHALHPNHDGLRTDFSTPAPSGDNLQNYVSTVKPELFSIGNIIELVWDENTGSAWTPAETLGGICTWTFSALRRQSDLRARGPFTMRRISTDPVLHR